MHIVEKKPKRYTEKDYQLLEEGAPFQLINGDLVMSPSLTLKHQIVNGKLFMFISKHLEKNDLGGLCLFSPIDVVLDDENIFQPDLIYISVERKIELLQDRIMGAPDLIIEILSPSTAYYDLKQKKDFYERYGVKEYLIIDPMRFDAEVYILTDNKFELQQKAKQNDMINFNTLPGLEIDLQKMFA